MDPTGLGAVDAASRAVESLSEAFGASLRGKIAEGVYSAAKGRYDALTASLWLTEVQGMVDAYGPTMARAAAETVARVAETNEGWARAVCREAGIPWEGWDADALARGIVEASGRELAEGLAPATDLRTVAVRVGGRDLDVSQAYNQLAAQAHARALAGEAPWLAARSVSDSLYAEGAVRVVAGGRSYEVTGYCRQRVEWAWQRTMQGLRDDVGARAGLTSVEISAHQPCAPDHLPYQGRVMPRSEFDLIQAGLPRPIGVGYNCRHLVSPCRDDAVPTRTAEELEAMADYSQGLVEVGGRERSRYEATQWQRAQERRVRNLKVDAQLAEAQGDQRGAMAYRREAREVSAIYREQSEAAGLRTDPRRLRIGRLGGA